MLHRIGPALVTLCVSALCISARMALASFPIEVGSVYDLDGFLVKRGTAGRPVYWLTSHRPGGARAADPWEVRLRDGSYPRALKSIHDEYTSEHRVIILGTGTPSGEIALDVMRPAFVPFVPTPELIKSVSVVDGVLKVVVVANNRISKEKKLLLRQGTIHHLAAPQKVHYWVERPDPHALVGPGGDVEHTLSIDLRTVPQLKPPVVIEVLNGKAGHMTATWGKPPR